MSYRLQLIKFATRCGARALATQLALLCRNLFESRLLGRIRALFFIKYLYTYTITPIQNLESEVRILKYSNADDIPSKTKNDISHHSKQLNWNIANGLRHGLELWIVENGDRFAGGTWVGIGTNNADFLIQLNSTDSVIRNTAILPAHRGLGLQLKLYMIIFNYLKFRGVQRVFISCLDYNLSTYRNIIRCGFEFIGMCIIYFDGRRRWYPQDPEAKFNLKTGVIHQI